MHNHNNTPFTSIYRWFKAAIAVGAIFNASAIAQPAPGDTFVHLFEWRWSDIATECEQHLGPKGFSAVQVSPPQEHIQGDAWWTRYQPVSLTIDNSRSGTRSEFIDMVQRCENAGVDIYVDAVINHMAAGSGTGSNGTQYVDGTHYPEFSSQDFHPHCDISADDYGNDAWAVRNCRLVGLPDLATSSEYVQQTLADYLNDLISIGVRGFRLDASKHMTPQDINAITGRLHGNPYIFQEVIDLGGEAVSALEYLGGGDVTEFKYSAELGNQFKTGRLSYLQSFGEAWGFLDHHGAVVFTDNHDNQRGHGAGGSNVLTHKDGELYDLANVFMLAWPYGYPKVMSSFGFTDTEAGPPSVPVHQNGQLNCYGSDWQCEHRWRPIANMVAFRQATAHQSQVTHWWDNGNHQIAFGRGDAGFVVINREDGQLTRNFQTGLPEGEYCNIVDGDFSNGHCGGETVWVDGNSQVSVSLAGMSALALHRQAVVDGGGSNPGPDPISATSICLGSDLPYHDPHLYYWNPTPSGALPSIQWPGAPMSTHGDVHCYDPGVALESLNIVFNDNGGAQTADLTMNGDQRCYQNGQWTRLSQCGVDAP